MNIIFSSERINFVKPLVSYAKFYAENINNPEIYRWLRSNPKKYTIKEEREWIKSIKDEYIFTIIEKDTNEIIGNCGFNEIKDNVGVIGIWITPSKQNKHYGREAIERLIEFGFNEIKVKDIVLTVFESNIKAIKCYKNIGFVEKSKDYNVEDGIGNITNNIHMIYKK